MTKPFVCLLPVLLQSVLLSFVLSTFGLTILSCNSTEQAASEPESQAVSIVYPVGGQSFKVLDTVQIIVKSDFTRFGGGVSVDYSPDSSKTWYLIQSLSRKPGVAQDTLRWIAHESGDVANGAYILLRAYDYEKDFVMTLTEGIRFSD